MWLNCVPQNIINNVPALGMYGVFLSFINPNFTSRVKSYRGDGRHTICAKNKLYKSWNDTCIQTYVI